MTGTVRPLAADGIDSGTKGSPTGERPLDRLKLIRWSDFSLVPVILVLMVIGFIVSPVFLTSENLISVVQQSSELSLLVLGQALILICGRMDLSLESTIGIAPVVAMWLVLPTEGGRFAGLGLLPTWSAIPLCLLVGLAIGAVNGFLMLKLRVNGFIATLGMLTMLRGLHIGITEGKSITDVPESFRYLGKSEWLGAPAAVWICLALFAVGGAALAWLRHGRSLYAIGGNPEAARAAASGWTGSPGSCWPSAGCWRPSRASSTPATTDRSRRPRATAGSSRCSPPRSSAASASRAAAAPCSAR